MKIWPLELWKLCLLNIMFKIRYIYFMWLHMYTWDVVMSCLLCIVMYDNYTYISKKLCRESYSDKQYASNRLLFCKIVYWITNVIKTNSYFLWIYVVRLQIRLMYFIYCFMEVNVFSSYLIRSKIFWISEWNICYQAETKYVISSCSLNWSVKHKWMTCDVIKYCFSLYRSEFNNADT